MHALSRMHRCDGNPQCWASLLGITGTPLHPCNGRIGPHTPRPLGNVSGQKGGMGSRMKLIKPSPLEDIPAG